MIQKKVTRAYNNRVKEKIFKKGSSCCPLMLKIGNWGNGLLIGRDHSKFTKYCPEIPTGYQALKGSHTKGSSMRSTSINTFPQCGKCWILLRQTKVGNEEITSKIGSIDHFGIGETIHSNYFK